MYKLKTNRTKSASEIILNGAITIRELSEVYNIFQKALKKGKNIIIDLSSGEEFDIAFVQLLISLRKSCSDVGITLNIIVPETGEFGNLINIAGLSNHSWLIVNPELELTGGKNE